MLFIHRCGSVNCFACVLFFQEHVVLYMRKNGEPIVECMSISDLKTRQIPLPPGTVELFPGANQVLQCHYL